MMQAIRDIEPGGLINIYQGLFLGYEVLNKNQSPERTSHLILLFDGYGSDDLKKTVEMSKQYNQKGIGISAIGIDDHYNAALLHLLSSESGGLMEHAGKADMIYGAFNDQLANLLFPVGKDATLSIHHNKKIEFRHVHGLAEKSAEKHKSVYEIRNLFMGQQKIALAQFDLHQPGKEIENLPVIIELSYFDFEKKEQVTYAYQAVLQWSDDDSQLDLIHHREQKMLYAIAIMNQSVKVMADAYAANNIPAAKHALEDSIGQVRELFPQADEKEVELLMSRLSNYLLALNNVERKKLLEGTH